MADGTLVDDARPKTEQRPETEVPERLTALLVAFGAFTWQAVLVLRGYFWQDDFVLIDRAANQPLTGAYLFANHNGNITPGGNLLVWLVTKLAPVNYPVAVAPILVLHLLALFLAWRLLTAIFGTRWAVLVPFTAFALAPALLTSMLWWAQALETVPLVVALLGALLAQTRFLARGRKWHAVAAIAWTIGGLFFWDKALLIPLAVVGLTLLLSEAKRLRALWPLWAVYAILDLAYLIAYLSHTDGPGGIGSLDGVFLLIGKLIGNTFLPWSFGGPWTAAEPYTTVWAFSATWVPLAVGLLTVLVIAGSIVLRRSRAVLAWLVLAGYLLAIVALLAVARLPQFGPDAGNDPRYVADAVPMAVLCASFAFLRPADQVEPVEPRTLRWLRPTLAVVTAAFVLGTVVTAMTAWPQYSHAHAKDYVRTAQEALGRQPETTLYDTGVPQDVMVSWFGPIARTSTVLGHLPGVPAFDAPGGDLRMIDGLGIPRPIELVGAVPAPAGPVRDCGYAVGNEPTEVPLTSTKDGQRLVLRLGYYSAQQAPGSVQAGVTSQDVTFQAGLHVLYVVVDGPVAKVRLWHNNTGATVCVSDAVVGRPLPSL
ncbi:hypothetical protein [Labedaea rhizosphaerae]|uniref:4-amino-4-deoxy-L-arabinose transferase-like glycosyltransferase n=1 Tax=Labedaea rhizosphaerae TaxID=598644 RepID=A0A4R6SMX4_LABRH|nr:hypothetical protein [Labedaea rhizosphaerae]TDQ05367.1 hypothetical protein EV186_1011337 [Labedaea rhizosphaerae]